MNLSLSALLQDLWRFGKRQLLGERFVENRLGGSLSVVSYGTGAIRLDAKVA
jgi:hypothetical protein